MDSVTLCSICFFFGSLVVPLKIDLAAGCFTAFYLAGGIASAVAQWGISEALGEHSLVVGASGAVMAVTGAFVAFFPRARVRVLLIFILIGVYWMPAMLVVGIYFALDIIGQITNALGMRTSNTAFAAHLGGSIFGFATAFGLLATGLLKRDNFDIFYLFKQFRRRSAMRAAVGQSAAGPWAAAQADTPERLAKQAKKPRKPAPPSEPPEVRAARAAIMQLLKAHDPSAAARKYAELLREHSKITFAVNQQLDLASALFAESLFAAAAIAYELYLTRYPNDRRRHETMLLLALLYTRKEQNPERARELIDLASARMRDPEHIALLDALRSELSAQ